MMRISLHTVLNARKIITLKGQGPRAQIIFCLSKLECVGKTSEMLKISRNVSLNEWFGEFGQMNVIVC